jgi:hypothetical protein
MVKINPRERLPDPLTLQADRAIFGRLGRSVEPTLDSPHLEGPPIAGTATEATEAAEAVVVHGDRSRVAMTLGWLAHHSSACRGA